VAARSSIYVLDSFALLAYFEAEVGMIRVRELLLGAGRGIYILYLSLINLGESLYITEREQGLPRAHRMLAAVEQLPINLVPVTRETVFAAAHIKAFYPISYADAFVVATAKDCGGTVVTGDPEFKRVTDIVPIEWLSRR
jgi:predicted nucleic acid-binding protein